MIGASGLQRLNCSSELGGAGHGLYRKFSSRKTLPSCVVFQAWIGYVFGTYWKTYGPIQTYVVSLLLSTFW